MNDAIFIGVLLITLLILSGFYLYATNTTTVPPDPDNPDFNWTDPKYPVIDVIEGGGDGGDGGGDGTVDDIVLPTTGNFQYSYNQYQIPDFTDYDFDTYGDGKYHWMSGATGLRMICQFYTNSMGYFTENPNDKEFSRGLCEFIAAFYDTVLSGTNLLDEDYTPYYRQVPMLLTYAITSTATPADTKQIISQFLQDLITSNDTVLMTQTPVEDLPYTLLAWLMKNHIMTIDITADKLSTSLNSFIGCTLTKDLSVDDGVFRDGGIRRNGVPYFKEAKIQLDILLEAAKFFDLADAIYNSVPFLFLDKLFGRLLHPTYPYSNVRILHDDNSFLGNGTYISRQPTNECEIIPSVGFYRIHAENFVLQGFGPQAHHTALADIKTGQYYEYQCWPKVLEITKTYDVQTFPDSIFIYSPSQTGFYPLESGILHSAATNPNMVCWPNGLLVAWDGRMLGADLNAYALYYNKTAKIFRVAFRANADYVCTPLSYMTREVMIRRSLINDHDHRSIEYVTPYIIDGITNFMHVQCHNSSYHLMSLLVPDALAVNLHKYCMKLDKSYDDRIVIHSHFYRFDPNINTYINDDP